jgi:hypothetical protein
LQRIAQRITSLIAALGSPFQVGGSIGNASFGTTNLPATVDTNAGNVGASTPRVVLASDQAAVAVKVASGAIASGAIASGAVASGAVASGAVASGAYVAGSLADGAQVTLGLKADAKSTATDTTAITIMSVLKQVSASVQLMVFGAGDKKRQRSRTPDRGRCRRVAARSAEGLT